VDVLIVTSVKNVQICERFTFCYSLNLIEFEMGRNVNKACNYKLKQGYKINK